MTSYLIMGVALSIRPRADSPHGMYLTVSLPSPFRHHHLMQSISREHWEGSLEGFLTSAGTFLDRETAWKVAEAAGQLLPIAPTGNRGTLFSEDLW